VQIGDSVTTVVSNVAIGGNAPTVTLGIIKFISAQDTSLSTADAAVLTHLDYGGMLYNSVKKLLFRIGNPDDVKSDYVLTIGSGEAVILTAVQLSTDNITYSNSVTIENIPPKGISDIVYVKLNVNYLDVIGTGTFLVKVAQSNA